MAIVESGVRLRDMTIRPAPCQRSKNYSAMYMASNKIRKKEHMKFDGIKMQNPFVFQNAHMKDPFGLIFDAKPNFEILGFR